MIIATAWLFLSAAMCALAWMAGRKLAAILLPLCVIVAAFCVYLPLGKPIPFAPKAGDYTVLGAKIVVNVGSGSCWTTARASLATIVCHSVTKPPTSFSKPWMARLAAVQASRSRSARMVVKATKASLL
jgi:hypothetical protein